MHKSQSIPTFLLAPGICVCVCVVGRVSFSGWFKYTSKGQLPLGGARSPGLRSVGKLK